MDYLPILFAMTPLLLLTGAAPPPPPPPPGAVKLPVVADTNVSSYRDEVNLNYGRSSRIRLKGMEMMMLAKFDTAPIKGWTVERASLFLHAAGEHKLKTIGISTIAVDWVEGEGRGSQTNGGATFTWADFGRRRWGGRQSDFTDAALTAQGTWVHYADLKEHDGGWLEVAVPPSFVHALVNGDSYGLAITDEKGQTRWNNDVHSREQAAVAPYLLVVGKPTGKTPPTKRVVPSPPIKPRLPMLPAAEVALVHSKNVIAWRGGEPPARDGKMRVWAYGECEKAHPISGNLLEEVGAGNYAKAPMGNYRKRNVVWDGARSGAIYLVGARNEFVAFHLCIEATQGQLKDVRVEGDIVWDNPGLSPRLLPQMSIFKDWYVKDGEWFPEVAVPLTQPFDIPDPVNKVPGQRNQSLLVEFYIPHQTLSRRYLGRLTISADGVQPFHIPLSVDVLPFTLPDTLSFDVDLNAYGPPGDAEMELKFHRLAHLHRATLNILGYSQSGQVTPGYAPPLEGSGKNIQVKDWTDFDRRWGRYFDGSAFADLPRKGVPLTHAYLPFCERYPSDIRQRYRYTPTTTAYPDLVIEHALKAPPVEEAFDQQFKDEFAAIVRQFAQHFREKGWTRTQFQFYLNNKYFWKDPQKGGRGSSWWLLDEPMHRDDWLALRFFGQMFKEALAEEQGGQGDEETRRQGDKSGHASGITHHVSHFTNPQFIFRADISRPQWQREWLDGIVDLMCVSDEFFRKNERCLEMKRRQGITFWHYGTGNDIRVTNLTGEAWALKVYLSGGDGFLPWNSLGGDASFDQPTPTTILYPGGRFGINGPLASLRLKAFRRGQQDVEYLALLAKKRGWNREQTAAAVAQILNLTARIQESFVDDAGRTVFENWNSEQFARLRASVAAMLK